MKRFMINRLYAAYKALKDPQFGSASGLGASVAVHSKVANHYGLMIGTEYIFECFRPDGTLRWKESFHNLVTDEGMNYILNRLFDTAVAIPALNTGARAVGADWGGRRMPRPWPTNQAVALGEYIQPTSGNYNGHFFICGARTGGNTTGASEPSWVTTLGATTSDDEVTWYRADWYIGLKNATDGAPGDLTTSKGWTEVTAYSGERKPLDASTTTSAGTPNGRQLNSNSVSAFTFTGTATGIGGAFLTNFPIKNNSTAGLLYGNGEFTNSRDAYLNDVLNVTTQIKFTTTAD